MKNRLPIREKRVRPGLYENTVARFLVLVMAKVLSTEVEPEYVFARHPAWKNGSWTATNGEPSPKVVISNPDGGLRTAIEIVTAPELLTDPGTGQRWKRLARAASLDLVVPKLLVARALSKAKSAEVSLHDIWSYTINRSRTVQVTREAFGIGAQVERTGIDTRFVVY